MPLRQRLRHDRHQNAARQFDASPRATGAASAWPWAALMRRVFDFDVLACSRCGGRLRVILPCTIPSPCTPSSLIWDSPKRISLDASNDKLTCRGRPQERGVAENEDGGPGPVQRRVRPVMDYSTMGELLCALSVSHA
jgi:hypothetical protein